MPEHAVVDAGGVVYDDFGGAYFGHGFLKGSGEGSMVGHVRDVRMYGCGGGGGSDKGGITGEIGGGAGEESDEGEAARGEETGDV